MSTRVKNKLKKNRIKMIKMKHLRLIKDDDVRDTLQAGISSYGLLEPITVAGPYDDKTYKIIDGVGRYKAMLQLVDMDTLIPCYIVGENISNKQIKELSLASNISNRTDNKKIMYEYAMYMLHNSDESQCRMAQTISSLTGMTMRYAKKYLRVCSQGSDKVKECIIEDKVAFTKLYEIVKTAPEDHEKQDELLEILNESTINKRRKIDDSIMIIGSFYDVLQKKYNIRKDEFSDVLYDVLNILPDSIKMDIVGIENM